MTFDELVKENIGPQPAAFMFGKKGREISELLLKKQRIEECPKDFFKWFSVQHPCWLADSGQFVERTSRERYNNLRKDGEIESQIEAIKKLLGFYKKFPEIGHPAVKSICEFFPPINTHISLDWALKRILGSFATELQSMHEKISRDGPLEKPEIWPRGGLLFPSDLPVGRSIEEKGSLEVQSLLFHLVYAFRRITSDNIEALESPGGFMPEYGKPCNALVADITRIVLDESLGEDSVKNIVARLVEKKRDVL